MCRTGHERKGTLWVSAFPLILLTTMLSHPVDADEPPPAINSLCPVMTDEPVDPKVTLSFRGKTIGFCCTRCRKKFKVNPDRYLAALPQLADAVEAGDGAGGGHTESATVSGSADAKKQADGHSDGSDVVGHVAGGDAAGHVHDSAAGGHGHGGDDDAEREDEDEEEPFLGRLHPVIIHFPLAGVPLALLGFLTWTVTSRDAFAKADVPPLLVAALASVAAVITGNIAHNAMSFSPSMHEIVERHQFVSTSIMILTLLLTLLRIWRWNRLEGRWRWVYGGGLCLATLLLMYTGFLGGSLVFGPDHLKL